METLHAEPMPMDAIVNPPAEYSACHIDMRDEEITAVVNTNNEDVKEVT